MRNTQQATALKGSSHDLDDDFLFCAFSFFQLFCFFFFFFAENSFCVQLVGSCGTWLGGGYSQLGVQEEFPKMSST